MRCLRRRHATWLPRHRPDGVSLRCVRAVPTKQHLQSDGRLRIHLFSSDRLTGSIALVCDPRNGEVALASHYVGAGSNHTRPIR
jgi:hypothetical protein